MTEAQWREVWAERAAIREYDGGMSRKAAEVAATEDVRREQEWRRTWQTK